MFDSSFRNSKIISEKKNVEDIASRIIEILRISDDDIFHSVISKRMDSEFNGQPLNIYSGSDGKIILNIKGQELIIKISEEAVLADVMAEEAMMTPEKPFDPGILDSVTRESVESQLVKSGNTFVKKSFSGSSFDIQI